jgi:glucose/mannose-6-phosphate isomerase
MKFDKGLDKANLRQVILEFPYQFQEAWKLAEDLRIEGSFNSVVVVGMGGSAMPGTLLSTYLGESLTFPLYISSGYKLPAQTKKDSLIFCISYSGNTEETLTQYSEAKKRGLKIVVIASGGKLINRAKKDKFSYVQVPGGLQPRFATGYQMTPMLVALSKLKMIADLKDEVFNLEKVLKPKDLEAQGRGIAQKIFEKTPVFYTSDRLAEIARIIKIKINENAKTPAFYNSIPEMNHNEMNGWVNPRTDFVVIIFKDRDDLKINKKRMDVLAKLIKGSKVRVLMVEIPYQKSFLARMMHLLILGDWISYYVSLAYGQDPTPVEMVEKFKSLIK